MTSLLLVYLLGLATLPAILILLYAIGTVRAFLREDMWIIRSARVGLWVSCRPWAIGFARPRWRVRLARAGPGEFNIGPCWEQPNPAWGWRRHGWIWTWTRTRRDAGCAAMRRA
jgi:hypothetical protein